MNDDEKTPVDGRSPIEMILDDVRAIKVATQNTETNQLVMYEEFKKLQRQANADRQRTWLPSLIAVAAALVSFACAVAAAR